MTRQFKVGETYATRAICDHDCIYAHTILARTAKTVTIRVHGETVRRGVYVPSWDDVEHFKPYGTHSMCAVISADDRSVELAKAA
jgi:hypothetical protein